MSSGTTLKVFVPRLHKANAETVKEDQEDVRRNIEKLLLAMAASGGESSEEQLWYEHVTQEIPALLEEYRDACFLETMAHRLIDDPDEADDELEGQLEDRTRYGSLEDLDAGRKLRPGDPGYEDAPLEANVTMMEGSFKLEETT